MVWRRKKVNKKFFIEESHFVIYRNIETILAEKGQQVKRVTENEEILEVTPNESNDTVNNI